MQSSRVDCCCSVSSAALSELLCFLFCFLIFCAQGARKQIESIISKYFLGKDADGQTEGEPKREKEKEK